MTISPSRLQKATQKFGRFVALVLMTVMICSVFNPQSANALTLGPQCFTVAPPSPVSASPSTNFKTSAQTMLNQLLAKGFRKFGDLDLARFAQDIERTTVRYVPALHFVQADGTERSSACWSLENGERTIYVSLWMWARTDLKMRSVIALHEFLGPAQFNDQDYQLTSALTLLASDETTGLLEPEQIPVLHGLQKIPSVNARVGHLGQQALALNGGGVIGVGGGGDWLAALAKLSFLQAGLTDLKIARSDNERRAAIQRILRDQTEWTVEATWH